MITRKKLMRDILEMQEKIKDIQTKFVAGEEVDIAQILQFLIDGYEIWLTSLAENMKPGEDEI